MTTRSNSTHGGAGVAAIIILACLGMLLSLIWLGNSSNVQAPAGYATYVIEKPIMGGTTFDRVLIGPSSTGLSWRLYGDRVSVTPYSYSEEFKGTEKIIAKDKLAMTVTAHIVWRVKSGVDDIRAYFEHFGGLDEAHTSDEVAHLAYENYIEQPFKTLIREEVATEDGLDVPDHVAAMSEDIAAKVKQRLANTPFEVLQVVIGNAQPPDSVLEQIATKVAKQQELARKATEQSIADADKAIQKAVGEASGEKDLAIAQNRALANTTLSASLTPALLQYLAIEGIKGADRVYVPIGESGLPIVSTIPMGGKP